MPKFIYTIISKDGKRQMLKAEAESEDLLLNKLQSEGVTVTNIAPDIEEIQPKVTAEGKQVLSLKRGRKFHNGVNLSDLVILARQLATMLSAGVTLLKSLEIICAQIQSLKLLKAIESIRKEVEGGRNFSDCLSDYQGVFPKLWVNLVQAGEASGNLPTVLERLSSYLEARAAFRSKLISAMVYPLILFTVATGAILVFTLVIVPKFVSIFESFQIELPLITKILISLSSFMRHGIIFIIGAIFAIVFVFKSIVKTEKGKRLIDTFKFQIPVMGEFIQSVQIEKFASQLSMLLESGVPILYSLEITQHSMDNALMEEAVLRIKEAIREGKTFHDPMQESGLFPPMVTQMIAIGEEIGELPKMCKRVATYYQDYVETFVVRFTAMLEPLMIVFMGFVVGLMVIAMYMPIFQMATAGSGMK